MGFLPYLSTFAICFLLETILSYADESLKIYTNLGPFLEKLSANLVFLSWKKESTDGL